MTSPPAELPARLRAMPWSLRALVGIALVVGWWAWSRGAGPEVRVVQPAFREVTWALAVSGQVRGLEESLLAPPVQGVLARVEVDEGDRIRPGQRLAVQDRAVLEAQVDQAAESLEVARARLAQACRPPVPSRRRLVVAQGAEVSAAAARLREAEQSWRELAAGPTPEEVRQVEERALQAEAGRVQASRDLEREEELFRQGASPARALERARTEHEIRLRAAQEAAARAREVRLGARPERLAQARAALEQARAGWEGAREADRARRLELAEEPRGEEVRLAQAGVEEARRAWEVARRRWQQAELRAPYAGLVTQVLADPGSLVGPGQPALRVCRWPEAEVVAEADEGNLARLRVGQRALLSSEAGGGAPCEARVSEVAPRVDPERGTVEFRLAPSALPPWFRPGLTVGVHVFFTQEGGAPTLVIPLGAALTGPGGGRVRVVEGGVVRERTVRLGPAAGRFHPVLEGLTPQDLVLLDPTSAPPAQRVRPVAEPLP